MCGIAGIVDFSVAPSKEAAEVMAALMRHRGPDESGSYGDEQCALAVARLSIVDRSHGHQPAFNESRSVVVVLNGEIYNHRALRDELYAKGHEIESKSDTSIIPHLYEAHGDAFVERLDGMFSLVLWDAERGRAVLVTDRYGKKPLYRCTQGSRTAFASEINAVVDQLSCRPAIAPSEVATYLMGRYVPPPATIFDGILMLSPGSRVVIDAAGVTDGRWLKHAGQWTRSTATAERTTPEDVHRAIHRATARRIPAEVDWGILLSGGIDSAAIAAAAVNSGATPRAITVGYANSQRDERALASLVCKRWSLPQEQVVLDERALDVLPKLIWHFGQPFADDSMMSVFFAASAAKAAGIDVLLTGDGGDEIFGSYGRIRRLNGKNSRAASRPAHFALRLADLLARDPNRWEVLRRAIATRTSSGGVAYSVGIATNMSRRGAIGLLKPTSRQEAASGSTSLPLVATSDCVAAGQAADFEGIFPGMLLRKLDVATMAASVEARSPFLDPSVARTVRSLNSSARDPKWALRQAFVGLVPEEVLWAPKRGFGVPLPEWLARIWEKHLRRALESTTAHSGQVLARDGVLRLCADFSKDLTSEVAARRVFSLLCLELWCRLGTQDFKRLNPPDATLHDVLAS